MNIDKGKCGAWIDLLLIIVKLLKELNEDERKYVKGCFCTALGNLELKEFNKGETKNV